MTASNRHGRFARQADFVPQKRLSDERVMIIGLGAVGRPLAEELAAIGVKCFFLVDNDTVEDVNITTQGFRRTEVGSHKVDAVQTLVVNVEPTATVDGHVGLWEPQSMKWGPTAVFCCVDSIETRKEIWHATEDLHQFWGDGRMRGLAIRVLSAWDSRSREYYPSTLFTSEEAQHGRCTARSAIWPARMTAGLLVNQYVRYLNDEPARDIDLTLNLNTYDLCFNDASKTLKAVGKSRRRATARSTLRSSRKART